MANLNFKVTSGAQFLTTPSRSDPVSDIGLNYTYATENRLDKISSLKDYVDAASATLPNPSFLTSTPSRG
jgi:hypothetical protein